MSLDAWLALVSIILFIPATIGTVLLVRAASDRPRIGALTERAAIALDICLMIGSGVTLTVNRLTGYSFFPIEVARIAFLVSLILLEFAPVYWLYLLLTHQLGERKH